MDKDLQDLMAAWLDHDELSGDRRRELKDRLHADKEFRREFAEEAQMISLTRTVQSSEPRWLQLEELMEQTSQIESAEDEFAFEERVAAEISRVESGHGITLLLRWLTGGIAVAGLCVALFVTAFQLGKKAERAEVDIPTTEQPEISEQAKSTIPIAVLARTAKAEWSGNAANPQTGELLGRGRFEIAEGLAQVDFIDGARVILRGPAELDLRSGNSAHLLKGSAMCVVKGPGQAFELSTPGLTEVRGSSEFGLSIKADGPTELHAISGSVKFRADGGDLTEVIEATAIRFADAKVQPATYEPQFFPDLNELKRLEQEIIASRSVDWYDHALGWSHEPETLLHYTFMSDVYQENLLENHAPGATEKSHGMIIGAKWSDGRWPWKKALEFRRQTDRVLLGLPGRHEKLTLAAWIRVDTFTQEENILLRSKQPDRWTIKDDGERVYENPEQQPDRGEIRWVLNRSGVVRFQVATGSNVSGQRWDVAATPRVLKERGIGQWSLLATTYDATDGSVMHYWNGRPVSKSVMTDPAPLAFEYLELGNPNLSEDAQSSRTRYGFFGAMGELLISRRILNEAEIAKFYLAGKPTS